MTIKDLEDSLYIVNKFDVKHQNPEAFLTPEQIEYAVKKWGIRTDVHDTCVRCQIRQMIKYENSLDAKGKPIGDFRVPCKFIAKSLPKGSKNVLDNLVKEGMERDQALLYLESQVDPVAWAELFFGFRDSTKDTEQPWFLRPYQKEQLRCSAQRISIREGRRAGKTFIIALKLIYMIFNKQIMITVDEKGTKGYIGPTIMIVGPYEAQLINVFTEIETLLKKNKYLKNQVTSGTGDNLFVKTPFKKMEFANGGVIKGFVSGVADREDGSGGGTMRGQSAHIIYIDEMDMVPKDTIEKAILPILLSDLTGKNIVFIATSTPIGTRGKFYEWCLKDPTFKEDHLPSTVLPQWEAIEDMLMSSNTTKEAILSEYMAVFIETQGGVFKAGDLRRSTRDFSYDDLRSDSWWKKHFPKSSQSDMIRCIGIDWNKNVGTYFVVVTYVPEYHVYVLTEIVNIGSSEASGQKWKEEVIKLNHKWQPDYIYADDGYGHTIIEDLKYLAFNLIGKPDKTPMEKSTIKIKERLKSLNFSSKLFLKNPIDQKDITKIAKEYLVQNCISIMENDGPRGNGIVWFPEDEKQLVNEMHHYVELKRSETTKKVVYGTNAPSVGDHIFDAFILAIGGIQLEAGMYSPNRVAVSTPHFISGETKPKEPEGEFVDLSYPQGTGARLRTEEKDYSVKPRKSEQKDINKLSAYDVVMRNIKTLSSEKSYQLDRDINTSHLVRVQRRGKR